MLLEIFGLYLQGLLLSTLTILALTLSWLSFRNYKKLDKTAEAHKQILFEALVIGLVTIPILAFAFMAILLMMKA